MTSHQYCYRYYLATSRELKRLDAVSRSPIFAWFSESLAGLSTIRAFGQQDVFIGRNEDRLDRNQVCYLPSISVNRWLAVRLELVGATIILVTSLLAVSALIKTGVDAGLVGLVLSYALNTTSALVCLIIDRCTLTNISCRMEWSEQQVKWKRISLVLSEFCITLVCRQRHLAKFPRKSPLRNGRQRARWSSGAWLILIAFFPVF